MFVRDATEFPAEVWTASLDPSTGSGQAATAASVRQLTHLNDALVSQLALHSAEDYWFTAADGAKVQGFVVKPPNFNASQKYSVKFLIHGGPQGAWGDSWSYRWNAEPI